MQTFVRNYPLQSVTTYKNIMTSVHIIIPIPLQKPFMNHKDLGLIFFPLRDIRQFILGPTYILLFLSHMNS